MATSTGTVCKKKYIPQFEDFIWLLQKVAVAVMGSWFRHGLENGLMVNLWYFGGVTLG